MKINYDGNERSSQCCVFTALLQEGQYEEDKKAELQRK
jgi:hypothetical protein